MGMSDLDECVQLCQSVYGVSRERELLDALESDSPFVARLEGKLVGYLARPEHGHGVAVDETSMIGLLAGIANSDLESFSLLVPARQSRLFSWCLAQQMRIVKFVTIHPDGHRGVLATTRLFLAFHRLLNPYRGSPSF